jgi:hypothetical protein
MSRADINVSGASGGGSSVKIYETPEYNYPWRGACVMHGSFAPGPTSPHDQHIEVVELCLPVLDIRVRADDVRAELGAMLAAIRDRYKAFVKLQAAVFSIAAPEITFAHIEQIAHEAHTDGMRDGKEALREQFRQLLDL